MRDSFLSYFFCALYSVLCSLFSIFCASAWGTDDLSLTEVITPTTPAVFVRKNPTELPLFSYSGFPTTKSSTWVSYSIASTVTTKANAVFLSVWAVCEETYPSETKACGGWVSLRHPGQTIWQWRRSIGQIYSPDPDDGIQSIYMDGVNPPYLVICPVNESQAIEFQYRFQPTGGGSTAVKYDFKITILGYLEGVYEN